MTAILPLERFADRVLANEIPEGSADTLKVILPLTTVPGEPFTAGLVALGGGSLPTTECSWQVTVDCPEADLPPVTVQFVPGRVAAVQLTGMVFARPGVYRLRAVCAGARIISTPTVCRSNPPFHIYWGDPHVHTILSNCHTLQCRSLPFAYFAGRYVSSLDWMSCADHVSNGRCALPQWREETAASNHHNDPGHFVTLPAYEASLKGRCGGDNNIYMRSWPDLFVDQFEGGTVETLLAQLEEKLPAEDAFAVPHHTTRTGKHGEIPDEIYPGPDRMPVVEISSCWGTSEYRGNPDPLQEIHEGPSYAVDLLNQGLPLGFIGGTDSHVSMPFQYDHRGGNLKSDPGGTGVYAGELTRDAVYTAIRSRSCYAGKRERSYLYVTVNGHRPGLEVPTSDRGEAREIAVEAAGPATVETIEIIRNGRVIQIFAGTGWHQCAAFTDADDLEALALSSRTLGRFVYYYVRIRYIDTTLAWSSPVWFTWS